jgi:predicted phage-related endonuclease
VIAPERFIARSSMRQEWLEARERGITATQVAKASTPSGYKEVLSQIENPVEVVSNAVMDWGNEREPYISDYIKREFAEFQLMPNDWLICADGPGNEWMMATPDMLSLDHRFIAEIKTSGKPLDKIPLNYMRQMQFQLFVTGAERCLFAYELRLEGPEGFVPGFDIETQWVDRDEDMISELIKTAQRVQEHAIYFERAKDD